MQYSVIIASAMLSAFTMPFILNFAHRMRLYDVAGGRKNHDGMIPRLGGVGMFLAFIILMTIFLAVQPGAVSRELGFRGIKLWPFLLGAALMWSIGLLDDLKAQPARLKLAVQLLAALAVVAGGYGFRGLGFYADALSGHLFWLSGIITIGWIVGVANAINFIDGLDGLAGSLSFIAAMAFGIFYYQAGDAPSSFICLSIAGVIVGFLFFNFPLPKAKLFMGDSGSLFLGFSLAVMPFLGQAGTEVSAVALVGESGRRLVGLGLIPSITLLALPVCDTLRVMAIRIMKKRSIMSADRQHIHHLFADYGVRSLSILVILDVVAALQVLVVFLAASMPQSLGYLLEAISVGLLMIFFRFAMSLKAANA